MDRFEQMVEGRALKEVASKPGYGVILRMLERMRLDLFTDWSGDKELSKDYCKGALFVIDGFRKNIDEMIAEGLRLEEAEQDAIQIQRGRAFEGGGTGDLAS